MVLVAASAVTLFCATGIAAIMGWIPISKSNELAAAVKAKAAPTAPASTAATTPAAPTAVASSVATAPAPVVAPVPVAKPKPVIVRTESVQRPVVAARNERPQPRYEEPAPAPIYRDEPVVRNEPATQPVNQPIYPPAPAPAPRATCYDCGTVEAVRQVAQPGQGTGFGAIAGGIAGGVLGHQIGKGRGRDVGTVIGAVGGAIAGHQVEKQVRKTASYEIDVRFEDGSVRTFHQGTAPAWRPGDRVKDANGVLRAAT
jgi:outer membrane lipoprotein SlyB